MSGAAKTTRRELRRAFGESGLHVIEQHFADHEARFEAIQRHFSTVATAESVRVLYHDLQLTRQVFKRGLFGRLKWVLLGR